MSRPESDTRTRILEAAVALLEADAADGAAKSVRMSDIAAAAGVSRQAVYLHFPSRAELLIAAARHLDQVKEIDAALAASRAATTGLERLDAFIEAWAGHIPQVYGVARALLAMKESDEAAAEAWRDRMAALRHGCEAAVAALERDGALRPELPEREATDLLWTLLSVRNWESLTGACGWPQARYAQAIKTMTRRLLTTVAEGAAGPN